MKKISKILFPVDFSGVSVKVVPWVRTMAEKFDSEIHVLFVAPVLGYLSSIDVTEASIITFEGEVVKGAEKSMEEFAGLHFEGYQACKTLVLLGDPADEILKHIETEQIDLVIMATHGRKGFNRIIFGSVASQVVKKSRAPVMSMNPSRFISDEG